MQPLASNVKTVWRIKIALFWALVMAITLAFDLAGIMRMDRVFPLGALTASVAVLGTALVAVIPSLRYRFWRYELRPEELALTRGIWNRVHTIVPLRRIQHLDVSQDIIERNFDLGRLIVHTAGTQGSSVVLPGLHFEEAEHLRREVKNFINEYAV